MKIRKVLFTMVRFLPAIAWMALIFSLSSVQNLELQGELLPFDYVLRKLAHMTEYAILTILVWWGSGIHLSERKVGVAIIVSVLYAMVDEYHQSVVPTRGGKITDAGIDAMGVFVAYCLIQYRYGKNNTSS